MDFSQGKKKKKKKKTERKNDTVRFFGVRSDFVVRDHRSLWYKIPSIAFCDRTFFADDSVAKYF